MIRRNIDVIAIAALLLGVALFSSALDSGVVQVISPHRLALSHHVRDIIVRLSERPPVRYRYY